MDIITIPLPDILSVHECVCERERGIGIWSVVQESGMWYRNVTGTHTSQCHSVHMHETCLANISH